MREGEDVVGWARRVGGAGKIPAISIAGPGPTPFPPVAPFLSYIRCLYSGRGTLD